VERHAQCVELGRKVVAVHAYESACVARHVAFRVGEGAGHAVTRGAVGRRNPEQQSGARASRGERLPFELARE
jgi:hypothetical protein